MPREGGGRSTGCPCAACLWTGGSGGRSLVPPPVAVRNWLKPALNLLAVAVLLGALSIVPAATYAPASLLLLMSFVELSEQLQPLLCAWRSSWASVATSGSTLTRTPTFSHALAIASVTLSSTAGTKHCSACFALVMGVRGCCAHQMCLSPFKAAAHIRILRPCSTCLLLVHARGSYGHAPQGSWRV